MRPAIYVFQNRVVSSNQKHLWPPTRGGFVEELQHDGGEDSIAGGRCSTGWCRLCLRVLERVCGLQHAPSLVDGDLLAVHSRNATRDKRGGGCMTGAGDFSDDCVAAADCGAIVRRAWGRGGACSNAPSRIAAFRAISLPLTATKLTVCFPPRALTVFSTLRDSVRRTR
jgi:hypothetical protein